MAEITIEDLIKNDLLQPSTDLYKVKTGEKLGKLNENGTITVVSDGVEKTYEYPSGAARWIEKLSLNGWTYWGIKKGQEIVSLNELREKLKSTI
ncbi:hypothetical protein SAMN05216474_2138 [Lishizhenia tianjinensis]|uniref:RAMA domain-containing protein n=1 Tax=Lishizhenia tianjinensis TaxID=477690 RepID=A0A1I7AJ31_9FLAO|nr:hypothetical protein [Lishizhenia tianjinensis]SFT74894.1 hypothetical protein SAMN05216474_2138 [Lishizhenia tianjinensis]